MKKLILFFAFLLIALSAFSQVDSTTVSNISNTAIASGWDYLTHTFTGVGWAQVATVLGILLAISETLPFVKKWENSNGILQTIFKVIVNFFNPKK